MNYTEQDQTGGRPADEVAQVIAKGHPPEAEGILLIDFDSTLSPFGFMFSFVAPIPGAIEFMQTLKAAGYTLGIFTSRMSPKWLAGVRHTEDMHRTYIEAYCNRYKIPFDFITSEKVPSIAIVDDKAYRFTGTNYGDILEAILEEDKDD